MTKLEPSDIERLLNVGVYYKTQKKYAQSLGISARTLRRWVHNGRIPERSLKKVSPKIERRERYYTKRAARPVRELPRYHTPATFNLNRYLPERVYAFGLAELFAQYDELAVRVEQALGKGIPVEFTITIRKGVELRGTETVSISAEDYESFIRDLYSELVRLYGSYGGKGAGLTLTIDRQ